MFLKLRTLFLIGLGLVATGCDNETYRRYNYGHDVDHIIFRNPRAMFDPYDTMNVPDELQKDLEEMRYRKLKLRIYDAKDWQTRMANTPLMEQKAQFRVRPGSTFDLNVRDEPNISGRYVVDPDGNISLDLLKKPINVSGRTLDEVRDVIHNDLKAYIKDPQVNINAVLIKNQDSDTFNGGSVIIIGNFGAGDGGDDGGEGDIPHGMLTITGNEHLQKVIALAGGLSGKADINKIIILRRIEGEVNLIICDYQRLYQFADYSQDVKIFDEDVIIIPRRRRSIGEQFRHEWEVVLGYLGDLITWDFAIEQFQRNSRFGF